jgi:hypothetical protein
MHHVILTWRVCVQVFRHYAAYAQPAHVPLTADEQELHRVCSACGLAALLTAAVLCCDVQLDPITLRIPLPKSGFSAPNLPELNHSQLHAVRSVLQQPLSLIQVGGGGASRPGAGGVPVAVENTQQDCYGLQM